MVIARGGTVPAANTDASRLVSAWRSSRPYDSARDAPPGPCAAPQHGLAAYLLPWFPDVFPGLVDVADRRAVPVPRVADQYARQAVLEPFGPVELWFDHELAGAIDMTPLRGVTDDVLAVRNVGEALSGPPDPHDLMCRSRGPRDRFTLYRR